MLKFLYLAPSFFVLMCVFSVVNFSLNVRAFAQESTETLETSVEKEKAAVTPTIETITEGKRPRTAASSQTIRDRDFSLRPMSRPADILAVTPGIYVAQHAGGGKANQYFLRGFDGDHGTDVAFFVDGIPINLVTHGHGQGYTDLNWIIPELIENIEVAKGPYFAEYGNFATAGALNLNTKDTLNINQVTLGGGYFDTIRGLVIVAPETPTWKTLLAGQVYATDGPFDNPEDLNRFSLFGKISRDFGTASRLALAFTGYSSEWNASGQIPLRAVQSGTLDRFGSIDPTEGGESSRYSLYGKLNSKLAADKEIDLLLYGVLYRLTLYSNFTFFANDAANGDQIEQGDNRLQLGGKAKYTFRQVVNDWLVSTALGLQFRNDQIKNTLFNTAMRERFNQVVDARIGESNLGLFAEQEIIWTNWLRTVVGGRLDYFSFDVEDEIEDLTTIGGGTRTSGVNDDLIVSPKANVIFSPLANTDIYLNFGLGFHSNDAKGTVLTTPVTPTSQAIGFEVGTRSKLFDRVDVAGGFFFLDLESEIVFVGDEGTTEAKGPSQRFGGEFELRYQIFDWLYADGDVTLVRARFLNAGANDAVPLAPDLIVNGGLSASNKHGWYGRLGVFYIDDRPANEDRSLIAAGFTRVDLTAGFKQPRYEVSVAIQNLFDEKIRETQFANASQLAGEAAPVEDIHFTPGFPFNIQATLRYFF